jgi:hypothetical protein
VGRGEEVLGPHACSRLSAWIFAVVGPAHETSILDSILNVVAPGPFPTEGAWDRLVPDEDLAQQMKDRVPLGRFGSPDELADLASVLLSDLAGYVNSEVVTFDGGEALAAGGQFNTFTRMPRQQVKALMEQLRPD